MFGNVRHNKYINGFIAMFDEDGKVTHIMQCEYDENGNITQYKQKEEPMYQVYRRRNQRTSLHQFE